MKLSPAIRPTRYERGREQTEKIEYLSYYSFRGLNWGNVDNNPRVDNIDRELLVYHGESGDVYFTEMSAHVPMTVYRSNKLAFIREYVLDIISELVDDGIIESVTEIDVSG